MKTTRWTLDGASFEALLRALHQDRDEASQEYERLRQRLIRYFEIHGMAAGEDLADMAFDRMARKLLEGETVRLIPAYLAGIARLLLREEWRKEQSEEARARRAISPGGENISDDPALDVIESCLEALPPASCDLIRRYYSAEGRASSRVRTKMANEMGISLNALRNRALRIRRDLMNCVKQRSEVVQGEIDKSKSSL